MFGVLRNSKGIKEFKYKKWASVWSWSTFPGSLWRIFSKIFKCTKSYITKKCLYNKTFKTSRIIKYSKLSKPFQFFFSNYFSSVSKKGCWTLKNHFRWFSKYLNFLKYIFMRAYFLNHYTFFHTGKNIMISKLFFPKTKYV